VFRRGALAIRESSQSVSTSHIDAHAVMTDSLLNHETVKYFDAEPVVCHRYDLALGRTEAAWRRFLTGRALNGLAIATIFGFSLALSLASAAWDVVHGQMTIGDFVLVNAYVVRLVQPLETLGFAVRDIAQGVAFLDAMLTLFREEAEVGGASEVDSLATRGELVFDNVSFSYRRERAVLNQVSFAVAAGQTVAVVGVSGSGKSSLIRLLFRLYEPDSGRILLDGKPVTDMPLSAVRQAIAVVPQDTVLFHDTIANNIGFGRHGATRQEIEEAAKLANLHEFIVSLPDGYETPVGERGLKLSGG
jgi:ATP-binding cassette subfamily B protein